MATRHNGLIVTGCLIGGLVAALALVVGPVAGAQELVITGTVLHTSVGAAITLPLTIGEEYGWRGYLLPPLLPLGEVGAAVLLGLVSVVASVRSRCIKRERASTVRHRPLNTSSGQRAELLKLRQELRAGSPRSRSDERRRPGLDDSTASAS
jgi:hypothetical protein